MAPQKMRKIGDVLKEASQRRKKVPPQPRQPSQRIKETLLQPTNDEQPYVEELYSDSPSPPLRAASPPPLNASPTPSVASSPPSSPRGDIVNHEPVLHGFQCPGTLRTFIGVKVPGRFLKKPRSAPRLSQTPPCSTSQTDVSSSNPVVSPQLLPSSNSIPSPACPLSTSQPPPPPLSIAPLPHRSSPPLLPLSIAPLTHNSSPPPPPLSIAPLTHNSSPPPPPPPLSIAPTLPQQDQPATSSHQLDNVAMPRTPAAEPPVQCSIRCKNTDSLLQGQQKGKRRRGTVNGTRLERYAKPLKGKKIVVEVGPDGRSPACEVVRSLLVHEIGSYVREQVPMNYARWSDLPATVWQKALHHIGTQFEIDSDWLPDFIMDKLATAFRAWKCQCHALYKTRGSEAMPVEFNDRPEQWQWLTQHFMDPKQKELCENMKGVRINSERVVHHSGKLPFIYSAERHYEKGSKAQWIDALGEVYGPDPRGAELVEKMRKDVEEVMGGYAEDGQPLDSPLPVDAQIDIIDKAMGKRKGTAISGVGNSYKRPPRQRGRSRQDVEAFISLQEQMKKKDEAYAKMEAAYEERFRALEAQLASLLPHGSPGAASDYGSCRNNSPLTQ